MGSLRTFTVLLTLGAWGAATDGAPPDGVTPPPGQSARPAPPAPPADYLKAGGWLFDQGDHAKAVQYLDAAHSYRDMLTPAEQSTLDTYRAKLGAISYASAPGAPGVAEDTHAAEPVAIPGRTVPVAGDKQAARWKLKQAREALGLGRITEAEQLLGEARAMDVHWGLFDDTPDRVAKAIEAARPAADQGARGEKADALAKIEEARRLMSAGQIDRAESIALEVSSWGHRYGMFEDSPEKVITAVRAVRRRDEVRQAGTVSGTAQDLYEAAVREARVALNEGRLDDAEQKATAARRMNVVPTLTSDRAESILNDVAMIRARQQGGAGTPIAVTASAAAEREANELLAAGQREAAAAKYMEVEQLRARELNAMAAAPTLDPAVRTVQAEVPADLVPAPADLSIPSDLGNLGSSSVLDLSSTPNQGQAGNPGEAMLSQAGSLMAAGNYIEARQLAEQAKLGNYGVEGQATELLAQIDLVAQGGALKLYEAALDSMRRGDMNRAGALLNEIASLDNQDEALMQKVQDMLARLPGETPGRATLSSVDDAEAVKAQRLNIEVGAKVAESRRLLETDPAKAIEILNQTLAAVQAADVSETSARIMKRRVEVALEMANKDKAAFDEKMKDKAFREEIELKRLRILEADKAKKEQVAELMNKSKEAEALGDYAEAEQAARMAAEIDPNNIAAVAQSTKVKLMRRYERDKDISSQLDEANVTAFQEVSAAGIAPPEAQTRGIAYPKSFADLTNRRRDLANRLTVQKEPEVLEVLSKLEETITLEIVDDQPLRQVVDYLGSYTGLNVVLDPKALAEEGLTENSPVSHLKLRDVKLKVALKLLLQPLGLTYTSDTGVLLITSPQASARQTVAIAYPVGDLVISPHGRSQKSQAGPTGGGINPADPNAAAVDPSLNLTAANGSAGSGFAVGQNFSSPSFTNAPQSVAGTRQLSREDFEPLIQLIRTSVAPNTWRNETGDGYSQGGFGLGAGFGAGGDGLGDEQAIGSITPFFLNISLIIRHTSEVHDEIVDLLRQLRRLQDLQISVEVRFITVSDSFFEQIGVDFDFAIQSDIVGPKSSFAIPNPAAVPIAPDGGQTVAEAPYLISPSRDHAYGGRQPLVVGTQGPTNSISNPNFSQNLMIPFLQSSAEAIAPFNALTGNLGATFGLAFLSDLEVYLFLTAVQGDVRSNLVQAPKVTTFNGAPASVFNFVQRNFVAAVQPVVGAGAVAFQPVVQGFPDGVQLFVTPVVSADRRYVRLTLAPVFQTLIQFDTFTTTAAVGGGGLGGQATGISTQIQLPVFSLTQVSTTVTVPDGGTVLLGGVKRLREERREFGVPILAKTPLINRLFRNIGIGRTTDSLMLMVTPRIIILEEEEERLGIPAVQNVSF